MVKPIEKAASETRDGKKDEVFHLIGDTPFYKLKKITGSSIADIHVKLEFFNPGGSIKDRIALSMVESAEQQGKLQKGSTVIEASSGNTGIALSFICASKEYRCIITMPESMSLERINILKSYGAEVVLTPAHKGMVGAIEKAKELSKKIKNSVIMHQFQNPANPAVHEKYTSQEIVSALDGKIDAFVSGVGTGGTITGVGRVLKKINPEIKIVAVEPESCAVISGKKPGPHKIQGIGSGFIPQILDLSVIDEVITVKDDETFRMTREIAQKEALFVGMSSGANLLAALEVAKRIGKGKNVVTLFPDTGERYLSTAQYYTV
ncbi:cysteine synthase A [Chitinispirillales bacterium ANBcel5]|uniref:cysteine synthase A n=1 Tax=Cellulosispirillum alkaliphilum TaxID=3039283 RepID=UPI002A545618|nr:cysteine synthase A [Chitinispirillales bacterium ANBcel5]